MIENDHQLSVTKRRLEEFEGVLKVLNNSPYYAAREIQIAGATSMIETITAEIKEYEKTHVEG